MAYNQDPYRQQRQQPTHAPVGPGQVFQRPGQQQHIQYSPAGGYNDYDQRSNWEGKSTDGHSNWDAKSYSSTYAGSQAHLNPHEYEMREAAPPLPSVAYNAYQHQPDYPPAPIGGYGARPGIMNRQESAGGYSTARDKMLKRRSVRKVELYNGNLVLDMAVPSHIANKQYGDSEEHTKMRYTAATCDPDDFMASKYSLRPYLYGRKTELFIVLTMYNEDEVLFCKTMNASVLFTLCKLDISDRIHSVIKNIAHLCGRTRSKTWGSQGWQKVVVCIVSDGRSKINKRTLQVLSLMGCYQEGVAKDSVAGKDVTAHIFEWACISSEHGPEC
jgi:chitin synthase